MNGNDSASPEWGVPGYGNSVPVMMPNGNWEWAEQHGGLTKRELLAAMAMQGFISAGHSLRLDSSPPEMARNAVKYANALISELSKIA